MAELVSMKKSLPKRQLVFALYNYLSSEENLDRIIQGSNTSTGIGVVIQSFRKDIHTFPRLMNILLQFPQQLVQSQLRASRLQLQSGEVYERQALWIESVAMFNNQILYYKSEIEKQKTKRNEE